MVSGVAQYGESLHSYWDSRTVSRLGSSPQALSAALIAAMDTNPDARRPGRLASKAVPATGRSRRSISPRRSPTTCRRPPALACQGLQESRPSRRSALVLSNNYASAATGQGPSPAGMAGVRAGLCHRPGLELDERASVKKPPPTAPRSSQGTRPAQAPRKGILRPRRGDLRAPGKRNGTFTEPVLAIGSFSAMPHGGPCRSPAHGAVANNLAVGQLAAVGVATSHDLGRIAGVGELLQVTPASWSSKPPAAEAAERRSGWRRGRRRGDR